jgi:hypothetical protein
MGNDEKKQPVEPQTASIEVNFDELQTALDRKFKDLKQLREEKYALIDLANNQIKQIDVELNKLSGEFRMIERLKEQKTKSKAAENSDAVKTEKKKDGDKRS